MIDDPRASAPPQTGHSRWWIAAAAAAIIVFGWIPIALFPDLSTTSDRVLAVAFGFVNGTIAAQAILAAMFTALGPSRLVWRLPIALGWLTALYAAVVYMILSSSRYAPDALLAYGSYLLGQWLVALVPLGALAAWGGMRIRQPGDDSEVRVLPPPEFGRPQFGLRQLMVFTAAVATIIAAGKIVAERVEFQIELPSFVTRDGPAMAFIVVANTILVVPLALAVLLPERSRRACFAALAFFAAATALEMPVVALLIGGSAAANFWVLALTLNLCQAGWVLGILLLVRAAGYRLVPAANADARWASTATTTDARTATFLKAEAEMPAGD